MLFPISRTPANLRCSFPWLLSSGAGSGEGVGAGAGVGAGVGPLVGTVTQVCLVVQNVVLQFGEINQLGWIQTNSETSLYLKSIQIFKTPRDGFRGALPTGKDWIGKLYFITLT